jgi:TRAP-type C4-dicarboxylate transport system permease small subunit
MKKFLLTGGRILVLISGALIMWGFFRLQGKYSSPLETLNHINGGRIYVALFIVGVFMIIRGNRILY